MNLRQGRMAPLEGRIVFPRRRAGGVFTGPGVFLGWFLAAAVFGAPALGAAPEKPGRPKAAAQNRPLYTLDRVWREGETGGGRLKDPEGIDAGADGKLYIADAGNNRIVIWDPEGKSFKPIGTFGDRADWKNPPQFNHPCGILALPSGQVYVADTFNDRIVVLDARGMVVTFWGSQGVEAGRFDMPRAVASDHFGNIRVLDSGNARVQTFSPMGDPNSLWGSFGNADYLLNNPLGMAVDRIDQTIVADTGNFRFEVFNNGGAPVTQQGWYGEGSYRFEEPAGAAVTRTGLIAVADGAGGRVEFYAGDDGEYEYLGQWKAPAHLAGFKKPPRFRGITCDRLNRIYLTDIRNHSLFRLRPRVPFVPPLPSPPNPAPERNPPYNGDSYPIR